MNCSVRSRAVLIGVLVLAPSLLVTESAAQLKPFTVSGIVLDTKGKPLAGAEVRLRADFVYGRAQATTGANGRYMITDLIKATYRIEAFIKAKYAGATVCPRLAMPNPNDYNSFPVSSGAERNFRWQLTGKVGRTDQFFGASIRFWGSSDLYPTSKAIELTLTPTGPQLDGSKGAVIVRQALLEVPASDDGLYDIPLGTYRLQAVRIGKDGSRTPIRVGKIGEPADQTSLEVSWTPSRVCEFGGESGVEPFFLMLEAPK
jgi:hypothetical protein